MTYTNLRIESCNYMQSLCCDVEKKSTWKRFIIGILFNYNSIQKSLYDLFTKNTSLHHAFQSM